MQRGRRTALPFPLAALALLPKELTLSKDANQRSTWEVIPRGIGGPGGRERGGKEASTKHINEQVAFVGRWGSVCPARELWDTVEEEEAGNFNLQLPSLIG